MLPGWSWLVNLYSLFIFDLFFLCFNVHNRENISVTGKFLPTYNRLLCFGAKRDLKPTTQPVKILYFPGKLDVFLNIFILHLLYNTKTYTKRHQKDTKNDFVFKCLCQNFEKLKRYSVTIKILRFTSYSNPVHSRKILKNNFRSNRFHQN